MAKEVEPARIRPVILCGGSGTRLWPTSRDTLPKQFAALFEGRSTFQESVLRVRAAGFEPPIVVTSKAHRHFVERQLAEIDAAASLMLEPMRRDTGPAVLAACCHVAKADPDALTLVLAADHLMQDAEAFRKAVREAATVAASGRLVTFGVTPTHPSSEYGYIKPGRAFARGGSAVGRFVEKPSPAKAHQLIRAGALWNAGNFLLRASTCVEEYSRFDPATFAAVRDAVERAVIGRNVVELDEEAFGRAGKTSFDYAVMEKTARAAVIPLVCGWSDIGNWNTLWSLSPHTDDGNVPKGDVEFLDSHGCYVATDGPVASLLGVDNLVVVADRDAILVADRRRSAEVKHLVEIMKAHGRPEADSHRRIHRPWGWFESLERGEGYQVKRIVVHPGGRLSLQTHRFRAEHWVVVRGEPQVTVGASVLRLRPGEHAHIPVGEVHRLENFGNVPVELIEVQNGSYLGEDDIVRLDDVYQRESRPAARVLAGANDGAGANARMSD